MRHLQAVMHLTCWNFWNYIKYPLLWVRLFAFTLLDGSLGFNLCPPLDTSIVRWNVACCYYVSEFCSSNMQPIVIYAMWFHVCMHGSYVSALRDAFDLRITKFNYKLGCFSYPVWVCYELSVGPSVAGWRAWTLPVTRGREIEPPPLRRLAHFTCSRPASWIAFLLCYCEGQRNVLLVCYCTLFVWL